MSERDSAQDSHAFSAQADEALARHLAALFSALSHDLRAALNGIMVWTHILERSADETTLRAVEGIRRAVTQQSQMAAELSDVGRAFTAPGAPPEVAIADTLNEAAAAAREMRPNAAIELQVSDDLPRVAVPADHVRIAIRMLLADLLMLAGEGARVAMSVRVTDDALDVHLRLASADGTPIRMRSGDARRALREILAALIAGLDGMRIAPVDDGLVLSIPLA